MQSIQCSTFSLTARPTQVQRRSLRRVQSVRPNRLVVRAEEEKPGEKIVADVDQYEKVPTGVDRTDTRNIEAGNISNENAERRADIGKERIPTFPGEHQGARVQQASASTSCAIGTDSTASTSLMLSMSQSGL